MAKDGPIIIIEDDRDDQEILQDAFREIKVDNKLIFFGRAQDAIDYLLTTADKPLIIISDVNLPGKNGLEFKKQIDNDPFLRKKSIPFIFLTTYIDRRAVDKAYQEMTIQGFFKKADRYEELKEQLSLIVEYWERCKHPNAD